MSWHYLLGPEGESSEADCLDGTPFAPSKLKIIRDESCSPDSGTGACHGSPSGTISAPSMGDHGGVRLMSSQADSRARTSPPPAKGQESPGPGRGSGRRWRELSAKYDRDSSSWKTHLCLFDEDLQPCSVTLPRWGLMRGGVCWERITPEPPTSGTGSGYWPTPCHTEARQGLQIRRPGKKGSQQSLTTAVALYPTPCTVDSGSYFNRSDSPGAALRRTLGAMAKHDMWPTPVSTDGTHGGRVTPRKSREGGNLIEAVNSKGRMVRNSSGQDFAPNLTDKVGGQLNPNWVAWLMAFPIAWTDLNVSAMHRFRQWLHLHGASSGDHAEE